MRWKSGLLLAAAASVVGAPALSGQQSPQSVLAPPQQSPQQSLGQALGILPSPPAGPVAKPVEIQSPSMPVDSTRRASRALALPPAASAGTIGVMSEGVGDRYFAMASDLASLFDKSSGLRVVGLTGKGTVQNLRDLAHRKGVDAAIMRADALDIAGKLGETPNLDQKVAYVARLQSEEMHILAPLAITEIRQLAGKKVNVSIAESGDAASCVNVFDHLGIKAQYVNFPEREAGEKLRAGEIDATVFWGPSSDEAIAGFGKDGPFHLLAVPYEKSLQSVYYPASFPADAYPGLVPVGQKLETISVNSVIAVYNWPRGGDRYEKIALFAKKYFQRFSQLQGAGRDGVWKSVNPVAVAQGWKRFPAAQEWIDANVTRPVFEPLPTEPDMSEFKAFLKEQGKVASNDAIGADKLFEQFLAWRKARTTAAPDAK